MITLKPVEEVNLTSIGLGPWSHSKLKMLTKCPLQFYLKYIAKAKVTAETPISIVTETGKAAHRILELVILGKSIDDAYKAVRKEYAALLSDDAWHNGDGHEAGGVGRAEYSITRFKERMDAFEKANPVKRYIPELRIGVTKDWEPTGFFGEDVYFRGVIDLIIQLENGDVLFLDHKFGPPAIMGTRNFQDQLDTYKVLFSKGIEPYGDGQSGIHFIRDGEIVMGTMTSKKDIEETLQNRVEFSIKGAVDKVVELGYFKHIAGPQCQWCDFAPLCKAGELKTIELGTKKWFEIKSI